MELYIFARFRARAGREADLEAALREVVTPTRLEKGCLQIHAFRSVRDSSEFYIHSRWRDEAAFEAHAEMAHTLRFVANVEALTDHALDVSRTRLMA